MKKIGNCFKELFRSFLFDRMPAFIRALLFIPLIFLVLPSLVFSIGSFAGPVKIGLLYTLNGQQEELFLMEKKYFEEEAKRLGAEIIMETIDGDGRESLHADKMEELLRKKVNAVVIRTVNSEAGAKLVEKAKIKMVPVIAYDRMIRNVELDMFVTQDRREAGQLLAKAAAKATRGKGNFMILMRKDDQDLSEEMILGIREVLGQHPGIKIVELYKDPGRGQSRAKDTTTATLTKYQGKISAILGQDSEMSQEAIWAVLEYDKKLLDRIFVAGADGDLAAIRSMAERSVQVAMNLANGEKILPTNETVFNGKIPVPVIRTPVFAVTTKDSLDEVVRRGFHAREGKTEKIKD